MDNIDTRLLEHWQRERTSREQARAALPASWRDNPHPTMHEVSETYLEAMREWNRSCHLTAVADDDRESRLRLWAGRQAHHLGLDAGELQRHAHHPAIV
jgi:hypothetical protein